MIRIIRSQFFVVTFIVLTVLGMAGAGIAYAVLASNLPEVDSLRDVRMTVPLRVYSRDGELIAEFGKQRRIPLTYEEIPPRMVKAFLAAEDERFFSHPGVDYQGLLRAVWYLVRTGEKGPGGSTITMQVARNFFLSREKTYLRKANEILLALKINRELSKEEVLELYLNKIFLGHRAYGVGAAAQVYYGHPVSELTVAQVAMIAGLPQAPSAANPISSPDAALQRRGYVLRRMRDLEFITEEEYAEANAAPITAGTQTASNRIEASYVAEMVRQEMIERFGEEATYTAGYEVYTTVDGRLQAAANDALRASLESYDRRHGYRGPLTTIDLAELSDEEAFEQALNEYRTIAGQAPALVLETTETGARVHVASEGEAELPWESMTWARKVIDGVGLGPNPKQPSDVLAPGDIVRVRKTDEGFQLGQIPDVEGSLVALSPRDGAVKALAGGYDFERSSYNRAVQAQRQPGSSFKPFIYSAALEKGFTPATLVNDAPVVFHDDALEDTWKPKNYSGKFYGPTRLRKALTFSRNLVSIRVLQAIGTGYATDYVARFGFDPSRMPRNLSLALGSASVTPLELTRAYAVFANGGFLVKPYVIDRVLDSEGNVIHQTPRTIACDDCEELKVSDVVAAAEQAEQAATDDAAAEQPAQAATDGETADQNPEAPKPAMEPAPRTLSPQVAYLMTSMMKDVVRYGTGRRAYQALGRSDLAGKTGTTNEGRDAWFAGFNPDLVAAAWIGFDQNHPLGRGETGSSAALPIWQDFMRVALDGAPERTQPLPPGMVTVRIDPESGLTASSDNPDAIFETFRADQVPPSEGAGSIGSPGSGEGSGSGSLF